MANKTAVNSILIIREIKKLVEDIHLVFFENKPSKSWNSFMESFESLTTANTESKSDMVPAVRDFSAQLTNLGEKTSGLAKERLFLDLKIEVEKLWKNVISMND